MRGLRTIAGFAILAVILYSVYTWISRNPKPQTSAAPAASGCSQSNPANGAAALGAASVPGFAQAASGTGTPISSPPGSPITVPGAAPYAAGSSSAAWGGSAAPNGSLRQGPGYAPSDANPAAGDTTSALAAAMRRPAISSATSTGNPPAAATGLAANTLGTAGLSGLAPPPAVSRAADAAQGMVMPHAGPTVVTPADPRSGDHPPAALAGAVSPLAAPPAAPASPAASAAPPRTEPAGAATKPADDFSSLMQAIQGRLDAGQLSEAQLALSQFYRHPRLTDEEGRQLNELLDQVTGTVIYSRQHCLEPAYRVQPGDSLDRIAAACKVPAELLAKMNGIRDPQRLVPGSELKVVRGPFDAVVDLTRRELVLVLGDRYAGRFAIGVGRDVPSPEGEFTVREKKLNPVYMGPAGSVPAGDPANPLGDRMIDLGSRVSIHGTNDPQSIGRSEGPGTIRLSAHDIGDVYDILSVGSRVSVRR